MTTKKARNTPSLPGPSKILRVGRVLRSGRKVKEGRWQTALDRRLLTGQATEGGRPIQDPGGEVDKGQEWERQRFEQEHYVFQG